MQERTNNINSGHRPLKNILSREQKPSEGRNELLSRLYPGHQNRMASHSHRVKAELRGVSEKSNSEATFIDPRVDIPRKSFDSLRLKLFQKAFKRSENIFDPFKRFAISVVESSRPIKNHDALIHWYEQTRSHKAKNKKAMSDKKRLEVSHAHV